MLRRQKRIPRRLTNLPGRLRKRNRSSSRVTTDHQPAGVGFLTRAPAVPSSVEALPAWLYGVTVFPEAGLGIGAEFAVPVQNMGNMDISELPFYGVALLVFGALVAILLAAKRLSSRWLRWPVRTLASVGMVLTLILLVLFVFAGYSCTARAPLFYSPDGKHVAVLTWGLQGALGMDLATVMVRHRHSPFAKKAYSGPGIPPYPRTADADPQLRWVDNKHLMISYREYPGYQQTCVPHVFDLDIICQRLDPWPNWRNKVVPSTEPK